MKIIESKLVADEGKILRRISDGLIAGTEIWLGYTYYLAVQPDVPSGCMSIRIFKSD